MTLLTKSNDPMLLLQMLIERDGRQAAACRLRSVLLERDRRVFMLRLNADAGVWLAGLQSDPVPIRCAYSGLAVVASAIRGAGLPVQHGLDSAGAARKAAARALSALEAASPALAAVLIGRISIGQDGALYRRRPTDPVIQT